MGMHFVTVGMSINGGKLYKLAEISGKGVKICINA